MTDLAPCPVLDPADWKLCRLLVYQPTDLLTWLKPVPIAWIGAVDPPGTRIEAELIPLTPKAHDLIPQLLGYRFACQGRQFKVTGGYVTNGSEYPVLVAITCEQVHYPQEQAIFPPLMLITTETSDD